MARKKGSLVKKFLIIAGALVIVQLIIIFVFTSGKKPLSFREEMSKKVASDARIPPERRDQVKIQLALREYRSRHGEFPKALGELVPAYFSAVPVNPKTGESFKYTVEGERYFLGDPGKQSDTGTAKPGEKTPEGTMSDEQQNALIALLEKKDLFESYTYDPAEKKDPFRSFDFSPQRNTPHGDTPLEQYSYDELSLTAVLEGMGEPKAIVEDVKGKGFTVGIGSKVGNMGGKIIKIEKDRLLILESSVEFTGKKKTRTVEMFLR